MSNNKWKLKKLIWYITVFIIITVLVWSHKFILWIIWKVIRLKVGKQPLISLSKYRFLEISGPSGEGKSWLLSHLFLHLKGVKFTNMPTPQGIFTLTKDTAQIHLLGKWATPGKWFYLVDDINIFWKLKKLYMLQNYKLIEEYRLHDRDTGSTLVQLITLKKKIKEIISHLKNNPHDFVAKRKMKQKIAKEKTFFKYLIKCNPQLAQKLEASLKQI